MTLLRRYVHGPGTDEAIVWYEGSGTSDRRFLVADERGSIIAVTNSSGAALNKNVYDEYGAPDANNTGRFQYTGQVWLPETGLYHYKARAYSPTLGRFIQPDPIGYEGGLNLYAYVGNDPINHTDPTGLECNEAGNPNLGGNQVSDCDDVVITGRASSGSHSSLFGADTMFGDSSRNANPGSVHPDDVIITGRSPSSRVPGLFQLAQLTVQDNRRCHQIAVAVEGMKWLAAGFRATPNVSFRDPANGNRRVVADLVISRLTFPMPEPFLVIDVKTGKGVFRFALLPLRCGHDVRRLWSKLRRTLHRRWRCRRSG